MVRHGYTNCTACHISPSGGGVLTEYGRELSRAILSHWGTENEIESSFAYKIIKQPEWLNLIGLYRNLYAYQNTPFISQGMYIFMQNDIEGAANTANHEWYFDLSLGYENKPTDLSAWDHVISRRNYINYRPTEQLSFRAGRFYPDYGILTPDHVIPIKRDLGWDEGQESYNLEAAWLGEKVNLFATVVLGRPDQPSLNRETGFALSPSVVLGDNYKVGISYFNGNGPTTNRNVAGPWAILGFTHRFFLLSEFDFQEQASKSGSFTTQHGAVDYQRLDYEVIQGFHVYLTQDFSQLNFHDFQTLHNSFGVGTQIFPRPHFEVNLSWQKLRAIPVANSYTDFAWVMFNFYL